MKPSFVVLNILAVSSIFIVICNGSATKDQDCISNDEDDAAALPILKRYIGRFCQEDQWWWCKSLLLRNASGDDGEDFRKNWPKLELNWRLVVGSLIGFLGSALGSAGGVGGGGYYLTMLNLFIGFDVKTSTALSKSMVMGAAVASVVFNLSERHPEDDKLPVIDYSMAVLFQPLLLLGISIGVIFNVILPEWLITVLFCIVIGEISYRSIKKGNKLSLQEKIQIKIQPSDITAGNYVALTSSSSSQDDHPPGSEGSAMKDPIQLIAWSKLGILLLTWVLFCVLQVSKLYFPSCSPWYWTLDFLQLPIALAVTFYEVVDKTRKKEHPIDAEYAMKTSQTQTENIHSPPSEFWKYSRNSLYGLGGGFIGGLLGVGGGAIMGPAFLELGLPPQVASSTASFAMVFSSSLSVVEYSLLGRLPGAFAIYCISLAVVASIFGQMVIKKLVNDTGKASYIVYCLAYSILASGVVLAVVGAVRIFDTWTSGGYMGFHSLCTAA